MKNNDDVGLKRTWFYFLLTSSTTLYIYSINLWNVNVSLFRVLLILWSMYFLLDIVLFRKKIKKSYGLLYGLFVLIVLLNVKDWFSAATTPFIKKDILNHVANLSLVCLVVAYVNTEKKLDVLIKYYILGSVIALCIAAFSMATGALPFEGLLRQFQSEQREMVSFVNRFESAYRLTSSFTDPTFYGLYLCFVIVFCVYMYNYVSARKYLLFLLPLNILALFLTMSRTVFFGFAAISVVSAIRIKKFSVKILWMFPIILITFLVMYYNLDQFRTMVQMDRFSDPQSVLNRISFYEIGLDVFFGNPFFGGGTGMLQNNSAHLVYLSLLAKYGLIGTSIYLTFLLYPLYYTVKNRARLMRKYVFLVTAAYAGTLTVYFGYDLFLNLEFQYLAFGFMYSIVLNRLGIVEPVEKYKAIALV